jgi:hypothetical protein
MHACQNFSVPSNYGRRSHLCDAANSLGVSLLCPSCWQPYPDMRDMCVSMLIDALRSSGQNERETGENGRELSENRTPGSFEAVSRHGFPVMEGRCHVTHATGATLSIVTKAPGDNATGSQASLGGWP